MREGRSPQPLGRQGLSHHRGMVGGTRCLLLPPWGGIVGWACATAQGAENTFQWLVRPLADQMIVLSATAFHAAEGAPTHRTRCPRGAWHDRRRVETVLAMWTLVGHCKPVRHRGWADCQARLACTMAAFNVLGPWHGLEPSASGFGPLSSAALSL
jgi:hypothetical protein